MAAVCYGLARFAYGLFVPEFRVYFGLGASEIGTIAAVSYVAYCVAVLLSPILTIRLGSRSVVVGAGLLATAGTGLVAISFAPVTFIFGVIIAGASSGLLSPALAHTIAERVSTAYRDRVQAIVNAGASLGIMASVPVAFAMQEQWRTAWAVFAIISAAITIWSLFVVAFNRKDRVGVGQMTAASLFPRPIFPVGAQRLLLASVVMGVASSATWTFGRDIMLNVGGLSANASTIAWFVLGVFGLIGAVAGDVATKIGLRKTWVLSMLLLSGSSLLLALSPGNFLAANSATGMFGATYVALCGLLLIWGTRVYESQPAAGVGIAFLMIVVGQIIGAPVLGVVADGSSLTVAFIVAAIAGLAGILIIPDRIHDKLISERG